MSSKKVIIIGAGIGGLSAAIQLASKGYHVEVVEKQHQPGGKIIQIKKNGFTFDGGASFITLSQVYDEFFASVGKRREDYIKWKKMETNTTFHFQQGKTFTLYSDYQKVHDEISQKFPQDIKGFERFMKMGGEINSLLYDGPRYAQRNYHKFFGFDYLFHPQVFSHLWKLQVHKTWKQLVEECFVSEELRSVFSYQATFMGMKPSEALGTYIFLPWANIADGMYAVQGGTYGIIEGFYKLAQDLGIIFHFDTEATGLQYTNDTLTGVKTNNGTIYGDIVVNNSDAAYFYLNLMPTEKNKTYTERHLKKMKHTNSYFTINLGLKKPIPHIEHHTFMVSKEWPTFFEMIFEPNAVSKIDTTNLCYYILQPSMTEPWMAPSGKATAFILVPVCGYDPSFDWNTHENEFKNRIYDCMRDRDGIDIREYIEIEEVYSPARWGQELNLWQNIILGFSLNFFQINNFRMPNKAREFDNLYHVGTSTIPGPGVPTCITSGHLVTERICEEFPLTTL